MRYWLLKSEPDVWSIDQQIKSGFIKMLNFEEKLKYGKLVEV